MDYVLGRRELLLSAASAIPAVRLLGAQGPQQPPKFSTGVRVVNVFATVRDKKGQIVRGLTKEDFTLEENGRPQTIRYFSQESNFPLTLGLLVDTSMSERRMLGTESDASRVFLERVLRPESDKAFLIHFDREIELLQDLTSSREKLEKALDEITRPQFAQSGSSSGGYGGRRGGMGGGRRGGGTTLFDAIYLASDELMKKQTGRKAIVLLTDGEDNASKISLAGAVSSAERADTLAYSIRVAAQEESYQAFPGPGGMGRHGGWGGGRGGGYGRGPRTEQRPDGKKILQQISKETGGAYFEVSKKKTVEAIYQEIEDDLRNQYSLGYTPEQPDTEGGYRKIQVKVNRKGVTVQARDGYYALRSGQ